MVPATGTENVFHCPFSRNPASLESVKGLPDKRKLQDCQSHSDTRDSSRMWSELYPGAKLNSVNQKKYENDLLMAKQVHLKETQVTGTGRCA